MARRMIPAEAPMPLAVPARLILLELVLEKRAGDGEVEVEDERVEKEALDE